MSETVMQEDLLEHHAQSVLAAQELQSKNTSQAGTIGQSEGVRSQLGHGDPSLGPVTVPSKHVKVLRQ